VREDRPGLARAHNHGLEHVTTDLVAFTDDDVVADPGWVGHLVAAFARDPAVGCVTGLILPLELETPAQEWMEQYSGFSKGLEAKVFDATSRDHGPLFPYAAGSFGSGANMAFRTDVLRAIHGFDPALGAGTTAKGGDDLAAFFDVIAAGYAVAYEPAAVVHHRHHRTFAALRDQTFGYGAGLTAYLTKTVLDRPARAVDMVLRAPRALHHALSPRSAKNERLPADTPPTLVRRERLGMLAGPGLYLRSRWEARLDVRPGSVLLPAAADVPLPDSIVTREPVMHGRSGMGG
jgi:GT2 family glycosyltransferase